MNYPITTEEAAHMLKISKALCFLVLPKMYPEGHWKECSSLIIYNFQKLPISLVIKKKIKKSSVYEQLVLLKASVPHVNRKKSSN